MTPVEPPKKAIGSSTADSTTPMPISAPWIWPIDLRVASFGGKAAYFGKVKADQLGGIYAHDMRAQGVRFESKPATDGPATARSFILVTPEGERTMNTYLGACVHLTTADVDENTVSAAKVTYMEGYLWDRPEAKEAFKLAAKIARKAGRLTSITLSDSFCVERHRESFLELIRKDIDIVFANETEIKSLYLTQNFDGALQAFHVFIIRQAIIAPAVAATAFVKPVAAFAVLIVLRCCPEQLIPAIAWSGRPQFHPCANILTVARFHG